MDIGLLSMSMNQCKLKQDVGIALMKMTMNNGKGTASRMTEMIDNMAVDPNLGQNFDSMA